MYGFALLGHFSPLFCRAYSAEGQLPVEARGDARRVEVLAAPQRSPCLDHLGSERALFACVWDVNLEGSGGEEVRVFIDVGTHMRTQFL